MGLPKVYVIFMPVCLFNPFLYNSIVLFMDIGQFIQQYFIDAIWNREGYNIYNTLAYAVIALIALYILYLVFKKLNIKIDKDFVIATIPFVLFGATLRAFVDAVDSHLRISTMGTFVASNPASIFTPIYQAILNSHIYDYGYFSVTPGIYVVVAFIFLAFLFICHFSNRMKWLPYIGLLLWLPHFLLMLPMARFILYPILAIAMVALTLVIFYFVFQRLKIENFYLAIIAAHALDGAATFVTINVFNAWEPVCYQLGQCYGEQHVVSSFIGDQYGYIFFFFIKVLIAFAAAYYISKEKLKDEEKYFIALILIIIGFAPGLRTCLG